MALAEIWEPDMTVVFVGTAVDELSDKLGFYHLAPRDRFWEQLKLGGITPDRIISSSERKALTEGQARGNLSDPVRIMFTEKKTFQLLRLRIGLTDLNRRVTAANEKDKAARPTEEDLQEFINKSATLKPKILAFLIRPDLFVDLFKKRFPDAAPTLGPQPFRIGSAEAWLLDSTLAQLRGEALTRQEDAFFELGERILGGNTKATTPYPPPRQ